MCLIIVPWQCLCSKNLPASQSRLNVILNVLACLKSCCLCLAMSRVSSIYDVSVSSCLSLILNVLARLVSWHLCLGKCLCLGKMSWLHHWAVVIRPQPRNVNSYLWLGTFLIDNNPAVIKLQFGHHLLCDFHKICRVCISFQVALGCVRISLDLLKRLRSYGGFKLMGSGYPQIFSAL